MLIIYFYSKFEYVGCVDIYLRVKSSNLDYVVLRCIGKDSTLQSKVVAVGFGLTSYSTNILQTRMIDIKERRMTDGGEGY